MSCCNGRVAVVGFAPAHLADLDPPVFGSGQLRRFAAAYRPAGPAFTLMEEGRALGCGGILVAGDRGRAWAFLSDALRQRPQLLHRTVKRALPALIGHYGLCSVSAEAHVDFDAARRWLERLGFVYETTLPRHAGSTEDYARYRLWVR